MSLKSTLAGLYNRLFHTPDPWYLPVIVDHLNNLYQKEVDIMSALDDLKAQVATTTAATQNAVDMLTTLSQVVKNATTQNVSDADLQAISTALANSTSALQAAVDLSAVATSAIPSVSTATLAPVVPPTSAA